MEDTRLPILVSKSYSIQYDNPIQLRVGDHVRLGEEESDPEWKGWIWAETDTHKGWIPMQILEMAKDRTTATVLQAYSAKELDVEEGTLIFALHSLNGWTWAKRLDNGEEGWIPNNIVSQD